MWTGLFKDALRWMFLANWLHVLLDVPLSVAVEWGRGFPRWFPRNTRLNPSCWRPRITQTLWLWTHARWVSNNSSRSGSQHADIPPECPQRPMGSLSYDSLLRPAVSRWHFYPMDRGSVDVQWLPARNCSPVVHAYQPLSHRLFAMTASPNHSWAPSRSAASRNDQRQIRSGVSRFGMKETSRSWCLSVWTERDKSAPGVSRFGRKETSLLRCLSVWTKETSPLWCLSVWPKETSPLWCLSVWPKETSPLLRCLSVRMKEINTLRCLSVWRKRQVRSGVSRIRRRHLRHSQQTQPWWRISRGPSPPAYGSREFLLSSATYDTGAAHICAPPRLPRSPLRASDHQLAAAFNRSLSPSIYQSLDRQSQLPAALHTSSYGPLEESTGYIREEEEKPEPELWVPVCLET